MKSSKREVTKRLSWGQYKSCKKGGRPSGLKIVSANVTNLCLRKLSGGATSGRARANALAEILPPWQSKVLIIKLYINIFWLPMLMLLIIINNNNLCVSNIRVSNCTLIYNVCPKSALTWPSRPVVPKLGSADPWGSVRLWQGVRGKLLFACRT